MCWDHPAPVREKEAWPDEKAQEYYQENPLVDRDSALMDPGLFRSLVEDLHSMGTRRIKLIGRGEPLLNPGCSEMVREVKARKMSCSLTTNGALLSEALAEGMVQTGLDEIEVSLNAATEETYKRIHAGSKGMKRVTDGIRFLVRSREKHGKKAPRIVISFAVHALNWREVEEMVSLGSELAVDAVAFRQTLFYPSIHNLRLEPEAVQALANKLKKAERRARSAGLQTNVRSFLPVARQLGRDHTPDTNVETSCYAGWYFSMILADGTVSPCCQCMRTHGNIRERSFAEIWRSEEYQRFREQARNLPAQGRPLKGCRCHDCALSPHNEAFHRAVHFYRPLSPVRLLRSIRHRGFSDFRKFRSES